MISRLIFFLISLFFCHLPEASSQSSNLLKIGYDAGFKSINVRKILKDKYGFIWIATQDGLYRYDAYEFEIFKNNFDNQSLGNNFIIDIAYDGNEYLYISTYEGGLDRINIADLQVENLVNRNKPEAWKMFSTLGKLSLAGGSVLVYNMYGLFAFDLNKGSLSTLDIEEIGTKKEQVKDIYFIDSLHIAVSGGNNTVYIGKLLVNNSIRIKRVAVVNNAPVKNIKTIDHENYLLTNTHLLKFNKEFITKQLSILPESLAMTDVTDFTITEESLYIATTSGVVQTNLNASPQYKQQQKLLIGSENDLINCLYKDNQQILWIGTYNGLFSTKLSRQKFVAFPGNQELKNPHLYTLLKDGHFMYACATNNLFKVDLLSKTYKPIAGSSNLGLIHHIINDDATNKIVSTNKGMALLNIITDELSIPKFNARYPEWREYATSYFNSSIEISGNIYWASENHNGLIVWDRTQKKVSQIITNELDSSDFQIHNLKTDRQGNLWLLCNTAVYQVNVTQKKIVQKISFSSWKETFNTPIFFDFYDDGKNYWFATYGGGLNKYDYQSRKWYFITEKDGLSNNCVYAILPDNAGNLWVSTNAGISMISNAGKVTSFTVEDGLQHNVFEEKSYFSDNDTLYLGGLNGFTKIIPGTINKGDEMQQAIIRRIEFQTNNKTITTNILGQNNNRFPVGTKSLRITVAIPDFLFRKKYQLFFSINKSEEYLKLEDNAIISLNNLTGKKYNISLKIIDPDNNEKIIDNFYTFSIRPKWHETLLFKILLVVLIASILYSLYRFRINQLKKVIAVRKRIATDLHDDLGGTLNSIRLYSHLAKVENNPEHLERITENTKEAVSGLKDLIWTLDDDKNTLSHLADKITSYAGPVLAANNIQLKINCLPSCGSIFLEKEEKRNIYLILKEAVTNSIKYANCTVVKIDLQCKNEKPNITYTDNGTGFDIKNTTTGNGLKNMIQRAQGISYSWQYLETDGKANGFTIKKT